MQESVKDAVSEIRSALRFRWYGLFVAWIVSLAGWLYVSKMPDVYQSSARVFVDTNSVISGIVGGNNNNASPQAEDRITYIREALLGRVRLETVLERAGLAEGVESERQMEIRLARLRSNISIVSSGSNRYRADNIYSISYENSSRETAQNVVEALLNTFVEAALNESRRSGESAEQFLDDRVGEYEVRLAEAEEALASFKRRNANRLPGAEGDYYDRMRAETDGLAAARRQLRLLRSKRNQLEAQLNQSATVLPGSDPTAADNLPANSLDARIRDYESQLDLALLEYTERHPDVIALRETLELLRAQRDAQLAALGLEGADLELYSLSANPVRQALQIEMNDTEVEIATLDADIEDRTELVNELQGLINELPQVEAELAQLNRDYEVIYEQYLALVRSREAQGLTLKATTDTRQDEFRVIDPPLATLDPVGPPRKLMYMAVVMGAIFAGALLCYGCSQLWPIFSTARALRRDIGLPVLGTVSHAWSERYAASIRAASVQFALALALLFVGCGVLVGLETLGYGLHSLLGGAS